MPVIAVESLTKRFGKIVAVDDVSFSIEPGTITGVLGPNGAGKTTTLRLILDLVAPSAGSATVFGGHYRDLERPAARVGALLDASGFHPGRSARNALRVMAVGAGIDQSRIDEVLGLVELGAAAKRRVKGYSMGMRQRLALAVALLGDPELLILDEPANGLDPEGIAWLRGFLRGLAAEGRTVLLSSHVLAEVQQTVDDLLIMDHGRIVAQGPMAELTARAGSTVWVRSPQLEGLRAALQQRGFATTVEEPWLGVRGIPSDHVGQLAHDHGVVLYELRTEQASLEQLFFQLTGGGQHQ